MDLHTLRVRAIALRRQGKSPQEIADTMGISHAMVTMALKGTSLNPRDLAVQIQELKKQGLSYAKIAEVTQCSRNTVYEALARSGLVGHRDKEHPQQKLTEREKHFIRHRYSAGASAAELAKEYQVSKNHIFRVCRGVRDTEKNSKLKPSKIAEIKRLLNVVGLRPIQVSYRLNVSVPSVYKHQFYDPILEADKIPDEKGWTYVRKHYLRDRATPVQKYWQCWMLFHEQKIPRTEIAKALNVKLSFVKSATNVNNAAAYRAIWELRLKRQEEKDANSNPLEA